jgi:hypothetical protein
VPPLLILWVSNRARTWQRQCRRVWPRAGDLGNRAGRERVDDPLGDRPALDRVAGPAHRSQLLVTVPGKGDLPVRVAGGQAGVQLGDLPVGRVLVAAAQQSPTLYSGSSLCARWPVVSCWTRRAAHPARLTGRQRLRPPAPRPKDRSPSRPAPTWDVCRVQDVGQRVPLTHRARPSTLVHAVEAGSERLRHHLRGTPRPLCNPPNRPTGCTEEGPVPRSALTSLNRWKQHRPAGAPVAVRRGLRPGSSSSAPCGVDC